MTDVLLRQTPDGGDIVFINGQPTMSDGLEAAAYLSLFGGNENDSGLQADDRKQWWGNLAESDPARAYRSETQFLLRSIPATAANLQRVEDAANRDLAWMADSIADAVVAQVTIPALNAVKITVSIEIDGKKFPFTFAEPWQIR